MNEIRAEIFVAEQGVTAVEGLKKGGSDHQWLKTTDLVRLEK